MRPDVRERPGEVAPREVGEGRPVTVVQAGDVERVPGDHLQVEGDLRVRRPEDPLDRGDGKILDLPDPAMGPDAVAEGRERARVVRRALLALPPDFREAVVLRDVNQLSYEEIAEALRVPLGTVKSRLSRARAMLAEGLRGNTALFGAAEGTH